MAEGDVVVKRLAIVVAWLSGSALASGWSGNSGGLALVTQNIWNLGEEIVHYCVERADNYPLTQAQLESTVASGIGAWQQFFTRHGMDRSEIRAFLRVGTSIGMPTEKPNTISLNFARKTGACDERTDIIFLFGKSNAVLDEYRRFADDETRYGLALRRTFDHERLRHGGYVWVAPLSEERRVRHVLLHELGHVFGMKHDSVFVMSENLIARIGTPLPRLADLLGSIEQGSWVYRLHPGESLALTFNLIGDENTGCGIFDAQPNTLMPIEMRRILGVQALGCHRAALEFRGIPSRFERNFDLVFHNEAGQLLGRFPGTFIPEMDVVLESRRPGVYTVFADDRMHFGTMDFAFQDLPAKGFFSGLHQTMTPARITRENGVKVEIFLPWTRRWWTVL